MAGKLLNYTRHAETVMLERKISRAWVENAVLNPDWIEPEPADSAVERRFCIIRENGNRVLRVVCVETAVDIRIISAFFDRKARKPQ